MGIFNLGKVYTLKMRMRKFVNKDNYETVMNRDVILNTIRGVCKSGDVGRGLTSLTSIEISDDIIIARIYAKEQSYFAVLSQVILSRLYAGVEVVSY